MEGKLRGVPATSGRWALGGAGFVVLLAGVDAVAEGRVSLIGVYGVAPFIAAVGATVRQTVLVSALALAAAVAVGLAEGRFDEVEYLARLVTVVVACGLATWVAMIRSRNALAAELEQVTGRTLATSPSPEEATQLILEGIAGVLGWQTGAFWEVDRDRGVLRCVALWHERGLDAERFLEATRALELQGGAGLPGEVWRECRPALFQDVRRDAVFVLSESAVSAGLRGGAAFPIVASEQVQGVIEFFTTRTPRPDETVLGAMAGVGGQLGQYIE